MSGREHRSHDMYIGVLRLEFALHGNTSLKGKRRVANSMKMKLRNKFNVAAAEVDYHDSLTTLALAAVSVGSDYKHIEGRLNKAINMVEAATDEELVGSEIEIFSPEY